MFTADVVAYVAAPATAKAAHDKSFYLDTYCRADIKL